MAAGTPAYLGTIAILSLLIVTPPRSFHAEQVIEMGMGALTSRRFRWIRIEAGPKGAVISLRANRFANPAGLVDLIQRNAGTLKLRPDHKIVYLRDWYDAKTRLSGAAKLAQALAKIARAASAEAVAPLPKLPASPVKPQVARRA